MIDSAMHFCQGLNHGHGYIVIWDLRSQHLSLGYSYTSIYESAICSTTQAVCNTPNLDTTSSRWIGRSRNTINRGTSHTPQMDCGTVSVDCPTTSICIPMSPTSLRFQLVNSMPQTCACVSSFIVCWFQPGHCDCGPGRPLCPLFTGQVWMNVVLDQSPGPHIVSRKRRDRPIVERFIENLRANHKVIDTVYFSLVIALSSISLCSIVNSFKPMDF